MNILILGSNGFVGKNIVEVFSNDKNLKLLTPSSKILNLLSYEKVYDYIKYNQPYLIINAAGVVGGIQFNITNNFKSIHENTSINFNIIRAANELDVKYFINLSSSCCYPIEAQQPYRESSVFDGMPEKTNNGYAFAKRFSQKFIELINETGRDYKTIISCNLFGKYDNFENEFAHLVPSIFLKCNYTKINKNKYIEIWGDGESKRELAFASDLAKFIYFVFLNYKKIPNIINFGTGQSYSINSLYRKILSLFDIEVDFIYDKKKPVGARDRIVDNSLLKELSWNNFTNFDEALKFTFDYFIENEK